MDPQLMQALQQMSPEELQALIQAATQVLQAQMQGGGGGQPGMQGPPQGGAPQGPPQGGGQPMMRQGGIINKNFSNKFSKNLKARTGLRF